MKEYVITDELRDKIIKWFNNIAEEVMMKRLVCSTYLGTREMSLTLLVGG